MSFKASQIRYRSVILIIVESGVFMAISKTIEFVLFELSPNDGLTGLNAFYIPLDCMPQIMVSLDQKKRSPGCTYEHFVREYVLHLSCWQSVKVSHRLVQTHTQEINGTPLYLWASCPVGARRMVQSIPLDLPNPLPASSNAL